MPRCKPGAAGWEARMLPLCYAAPLQCYAHNNSALKWTTRLNLPMWSEFRYFIGTSPAMKQAVTLLSTDNTAVKWTTLFDWVLWRLLVLYLTHSSAGKIVKKSSWVAVAKTDLNSCSAGFWVQQGCPVNSRVGGNCLSASRCLQHHHWCQFKSNTLL